MNLSTISAGSKGVDLLFDGLRRLAKIQRSFHNKINDHVHSVRVAFPALCMWFLKTNNKKKYMAKTINVTVFFLKSSYFFGYNRYFRCVISLIVIHSQPYNMVIKTMKLNSNKKNCKNKHLITWLRKFQHNRYLQAVVYIATCRLLFKLFRVAVLVPTGAKAQTSLRWHVPPVDI